jgi:glycosyltransferase
MSGGVRISIVTVVLNRASRVARALDSVAAQDHPNVQHVVIDGGSTDGTLEIIRARANLTWISEPDRNLYDAWNKGLALCDGEVIGIVNSDDALKPGALAEVARLAAAHPEADMITGAAEVATEFEGVAASIRLIDAAELLALREANLIGGIPLTNARFLRRRLFERVARYDIRFPVVADSDFLMRCLVAGLVNVATPVPLYRYYAHEGSLTFSEKEGGSIRTARSLMAMTESRLPETAPGPERTAYRRWHAWNVTYLALLAARQGAWGEALRVGLGQLGRDPLYPARALPLIWRHWRETPLRRGRIVPDG